jgi:hypothetical protein
MSVAHVRTHNRYENIKQSMVLHQSTVCICCLGILSTARTSITHSLYSPTRVASHPTHKQVLDNENLKALTDLIIMIYWC